MSNEPTVITRTEQNDHLCAVEGVAEHQPKWADSECPNDGDGYCGPHPDVLVCDECEEDWPCAVVQAVIVELEAQADGLCCGGIIQSRISQLRGEVSE
jgi:hypothetical protein